MKHSTGKQTVRERARISLIMSLTCIYCTLSGDFKKRELECHHIVRGNKRLGHWYTLQVCVGHHRGEWTDQAIRVGIASGRHALKEAYGYDELELWQRQQVALNLDDELPATKILPRRLGGGRYGNLVPVRPTVDLYPADPDLSAADHAPRVHGLDGTMDRPCPRVGKALESALRMASDVPDEFVPAVGADGPRR